MMRLSVITINFNNLAGLQRTLDSVRSQRCRDFEWIVVDGGSTDGSRELIEANASLITRFVSEPDEGVYHAMNKGIAMASGEYLQFLNSGDCFHDDAVTADFLTLDASADLVCGDSDLTDASGRVVSSVHAPDSLSMLFFYNNNLNHQAVFFSRRALGNLRYDTRWRLCADRHLILRMLMAGASYHHWPRTVVYYDLTGLSSTLTSKMKTESDTIMEEILPPMVRPDYTRFVKMRDVNLARWIDDIINSSRPVRYLARILLYPVHLLAKK